MKKLFFISIFCTILYGDINSQIAWFKTYDFGYTYTQEIIGLSEFDHHYFVLRFSANKSAPKTNSGICKMDSTGNLVWSNEAHYPPESNSNIGIYFPCRVIVSKDGSVYYFSISVEKNIEKILVNKFKNSDGSLIWSKTYEGDSTGNRTGIGGMALSKDSLGLIIASQDDTAKKYIVYHIDSAGTEVNKTISNVPLYGGQVGNFQPLVRMPDNSLRSAYDSNVSTDYKDYLINMDSTGVPLNVYANPTTGRTLDLKLHPNGNLVYLSDERNPAMTEDGGMRIQMFTPDLVPVWNYLYFDYVFPNIFNENGFVNNLSINPNGKILASGSGAPKNLHLVVLNPDGSLAWKREIVLDEVEPPILTGQKIEYAIWTSDGGILVGGYIYGGDYNTKIFLLKLDSLGCLKPGCEDVYITPTHEIVESFDRDCWNISPNPANKFITIEKLDGGESNSIIKHVELIDELGQSVQSKSMLGNQSVQFDLSTVKNGFYFAKIYNDKKLVFAKKIIVNH